MLAVAAQMMTHMEVLNALSEYARAKPIRTAPVAAAARLCEI
jgi:hypothetical protein